jgi:protein-disulfide isomerase
MLKLLAPTLLLSSFLQASTSNENVENFLKKQFADNSNIVKAKVSVEQTIPLENVKDWNAYIVVVATVKAKKGTRELKQKMIWFSNGETISPDLFDIKTGTSLKDSVSPTMQESFYKKENLIYGNADAKHKVAIFSDPLCPFCRNFVPEAINTMKENPNKFAVYYYHFPLPAIHPAAVTLVYAAAAAELKGLKDVVLNLYTVEIDAQETDTKKILKAFNKTMKTNITPEDLKSKAVLDHIKSDLDIADTLMVRGTPTMFFDGKVDKKRKKFEEAK